MELETYYSGNEWYAYQFFGAHVKSDGVHFRVYAPNAKRVTIIGEFNYWHDQEMQLQGRGGIYYKVVPDAKPGQMYKYRIYHGDGTVTDKADPYGFAMELRPCSASIIVEENTYTFSDDEWMGRREKLYNHPFHIYEIHFGSWRTKDGKWYSYKELGQYLIPYLKDMGYTHVELMPINEHPMDESWGYQSTGFFAPTARYGDPDGLKYFIDCCHRENIGVLLDFVMVHFAVDDYGLEHFDGKALYEMPYDDVEHSEWGSYNFAHGRGEVASFLKSCANYWLSEFHFDGLRMDAISNIIYWRGQEHLGVNNEAVRFVQELNDGLHNIHPSAILVAEDSTSYLKVTAPVAYGGLGFDYKWDIGFMHDTLDFFQKSPEQRRRDYGQILFSMHYFYNELYLLAFSHDECVHGKKTILDKMYGSYEDKFPQCRCLFLYMMTHPGKKLNFMGNEIGQFREWAEYREQDFDVLQGFPKHREFMRYMRDLNQIYLHHKALNEGEYNAACFDYVLADKSQDLLYGYTRTAGGEKIFVLLNMGDQDFIDYQFYLQGNHMLREIMNSDWEIYGGNKSVQHEEIMVRSGTCRMSIAKYSGRLFQIL